MRSGRSGFRASAPLLWPLLTGLRAMGVNVEAVVARAGLSLEQLADPDTRIPIESAVDVAVAADAEIGDDAFGLHLAEHYQPGVFGVLDYLAHSSHTLGDALRRLCRYNRLLQDAVETELHVDGAQAIIRQNSVGAWFPPPGVTENAIANLIVIGRKLSGTELTPLEVRFRHAEPTYSAEHRRIFRAPVLFDADWDGLILAVEALDLPLPNADPTLCDILDRHARQLLAELPRVALFSQRVQELVAERLKEGTPTAESIARALQMSERTLRRRLRDEQTSYERVLDELRRALATRYLDQSSLSTEEVTLLLGYSDVSAFRRAFRRWHGIAPAAYRRQRRASAAQAPSTQARRAR
jgi:AraC-like DNA-binding protein